MIEKVRPNTEIKWDSGRYYIHYSCPKCGRSIACYKSSTACYNCGTFYDWGEKVPEIVIERTVKW